MITTLAIVIDIDIDMIFVSKYKKSQVVFLARWMVIIQVSTGRI